MSKSSSSLVRVASSLFFLSGFAALIYEVIWFKRFTHVWGSSTLSQTVVVTAFLFGLAAGAFWIGRLADRVRSPLLWYSYCEIAIGIFGLLIPYEIVVLRWISASIYPAMQSYPAFQFAVRFLLTFLVIGPPCILMGGTLPLLMKHFLIVQPWTRETTGWLYAINTLGAAFGAFFAGFYLLPGLGMIGANALAAAINFYIALLVFLLLRQIPKELPDAVSEPIPNDDPFPAMPPDATAGFSHRAIYLASALTGGAALILQMIWTRNLAVILGGTTYAFSSMLFVFLLGIGLGSLIYSRTVRRIRQLPWVLTGLISILVLSIAIGKYLIPYLGMAVGFMRGLRSDPILNALISTGVNAALQLVPTLCMGYLFPLYVDLLRWRTHDVGAVVGNIYTWNTAGSLLGTALTPIALIAVWGTASATALAMTLYALSLLLVFPYSQRRSRIALAPALGLTLILLPSVSRTEDPRLTNMGQFLYGYLPSEDILEAFTVLYFKEGTSCNVMVLESDVNRHLRVNGKVDAGDTGDMPMQMGLAYYPRLFHPEARDVLVIGYGSGTTAGASLMFPNTRVTCCEIEPAVVEAGVHFSHVNHQPERSRNFRLILDDGRIYLEGCRESFDLILSEPSNPWMAGISNLFTQEFYREAQRHLRPGGIFTQWIHTYNFTSAEYTLIARTLLEVFPHCALIRISSSDTLLLASERSLLPGLEELRAAQTLVDESPAVSEDLEILFNTKDVATLLLKNYLMPEEAIHRFIESEKQSYLNTDISLRLEYTAPLQLFIPQEWQENVDKTLIGAADPNWWLERFRDWNGTSHQASALKAWIRRLLENDYNDRCKDLMAFTLNLIPDDPYLLAENLYYSLDNPAEFDRILARLIPLSADEAYRVALVLREKKHAAQAAKVLEKVVEQRPSWATAWTYLALCYSDTSQWKEAEDKFAKAMMADPNNPFLKESYEKYQKDRAPKAKAFE